MRLDYVRYFLRIGVRIFNNYRYVRIFVEIQNSTFRSTVPRRFYLYELNSMENQTSSPFLGGWTFVFQAHYLFSDLSAATTIE